MKTVDVKNRSSLTTWKLVDLSSVRNAAEAEGGGKKSKAQAQMDAALAGDSD